MAYLNQNYNEYTFVQHYLQRCSQVQRAADSDPIYQQTLQNKEQPPVIVLDDDEDEDEEMQRRSNFLGNLNNFVTNFGTNPVTKIDEFFATKKNTIGNFLEATESSDLHITGVSVLKEWIDISELDLRKYANFCDLNEKNLRENEERRLRNSVSQKKRNGENRNCANLQKIQKLSNSSKDNLTERNEERRNRNSVIQNLGSKNGTKGETQRTENLVSIEIEEDEEGLDSQEKENTEEQKNCVNQEIEKNFPKQILEGKKYANEGTTHEAQTEESVPKTEENDMTWADLNVEEDIETDEEKEVEVQNDEDEAQNEETLTLGRYKCSHCPYRTSWKSNLTKHIVSRHQSSEEIRWFQCAHCPYKGKTREYLRVHLRMKHEQFITWHGCPTCLFKFKSKQLLQDHIIALHTAPEDVKWFECDKCNFKCKFKQGLKDHRINRHLEANEIRWFACKECHYKGKRRRALRKHVANRHKKCDKVWVKCEKCEYECGDRARLSAHVRMCHVEEAESRRAGIGDDVAEEELECKMCGFKTRSRMDYQEHFRFEGSSCYWRLRNT